MELIPDGNPTRPLVARADSAGFASLQAVPFGRYTMRILSAQHGWLVREGLIVGSGAALAGMSIPIQPLLSAGGVVDAQALDMLVPETSTITIHRVCNDGVRLTKRASLDVNGTFQLTGLLPGRYEAMLRVAQLQRGRRPGVRPPSPTSPAIRLADFEVPERTVFGLRLDRKRD